MKIFCRELELPLSEKFEINIEIYVSKKKKQVHMSLEKPLL